MYIYIIWTFGSDVSPLSWHEEPLHLDFCRLEWLEWLSDRLNDADTVNYEDAMTRTGVAMMVMRLVLTCSKDGYGGGSVVLVIRGIGHASFTDAEVLFGNLAPNLGVRPPF